MEVLGVLEHLGPGERRCDRDVIAEGRNEFVSAPARDGRRDSPGEFVVTFHTGEEIEVAEVR